MEQPGVAYERHHKFDIKEPFQTIQENSLSDLIAHAKAVISGKPF